MTRFTSKLLEKPRQSRHGPRPSTASEPYRALCVLLWGRMSWITRNNNEYIFRASNLYKLLKTDQDILKSSLNTLVTWGLVLDYKWVKGLVYVTIEVPVGMAIHIPSTYPSDMEPELLEIIATEAENE